jgi:hypothetical protein
MLFYSRDDFKAHEIEVVVDNARTHSARAYSIENFSEGIHTACSDHVFRYLDIQSTSVSMTCHFMSDPDRAKSKGLAKLAKDHIRY